MKLSVIICVFNEINTIQEIIRRVLNCKLPKNYNKELVIVDNNSNDGTKNILEKYKKDNNIKIIYQNKNMGKGNSLRKGIEYSKGDLIIFQDADLEYNPGEYINLMSFMNSNKLDAVFGSRILKNNSYHVYKLNKIAVVLLTYLINLLFSAKYTDTATNYKLCKRNVLNKLNLQSNYFNIDFEIASKLAKYKYKVGETKISYNPRKYKDGKKIKFIDAIYSILTILNCYFKK